MKNVRSNETNKKNIFCDLKKRFYVLINERMIYTKSNVRIV